MIYCIRLEQARTSFIVTLIREMKRATETKIEITTITTEATTSEYEKLKAGTRITQYMRAIITLGRINWPDRMWEAADWAQMCWNASCLRVSTVHAVP